MKKLIDKIDYQNLCLIFYSEIYINVRTTYKPKFKKKEDLVCG